MMSHVRAHDAIAAKRAELEAAPKPIDKILTSELEEELARRKHTHLVQFNEREIGLNLDEMRILRDAIDQILVGNKVRTERISKNPVESKG